MKNKRKKVYCATLKKNFYTEMYENRCRKPYTWNTYFGSAQQMKEIAHTSFNDIIVQKKMFM